MAKIYNYHNAFNMVCAVSTSYVRREEIREYFKKNYNEDKEFSGEEIKQIVSTLVSGRERISPTMREIGYKKWFNSYEDYER